MPVNRIVDIYCRISTDGQEENTSLDEQESSGREYCRQNSLIVGMVHREIFTGFQYRERKELEVMRNRYQNGKIHGVVIRTLDRLSRSQVHNAILMEEMEHFGVTLYCAKESIDDSSMGKFIRMVLAFVAEMEREKIMDRTMTGRINAILGGNMRAVSSRKLRYGFKWANDTDSIIVLNEAEADIIRWLAEQYAAGVGSITLRQMLDKRGVPSPSGSTWNEGTIMRILGDRRITGTGAQVFRHKAKQYKTHYDTVDIPDGTYPAIISVELFEQIDRRMKLNKAQASRSSKNPKEFLLRAGYIRCSMCGWSMGARTDVRYSSYIYRCRKHGSIVSKPLDQAIWRKIEELADHVTLIEEAIQLASQDTRLQRDVAAIDNSIDRWEKSAANYLEDLKDSSLTGDSRAGIRKLMNDANIMVKRLQGERAQVAAGLVDKKREQAAYDEILAWCKEVKEAREELSYQRKRDFLDMLGLEVTIYYEKDKGNQCRPTYDMRVRLPALQELISLPGTDGELVTPTSP